ncbi:MAG TPA: TCR/Tet family MFS transporter [Candidatus Sulfotelmatobacter sp.]|jgi:DHA1 family tetracycline resistance protein-like MFS transporter|nr:TCR/Tet family MFS transporter [Candidatus Sulfotelmatobacter sp.]
MEEIGTGVVNGGAAGPRSPVAASRATFVFIIVTVTLDFLAFGIIAPVLPNLIIRFEGGNMARASDITGYFGFAWNLMQFLFLPVLGAWSDRFGRRPVILISCLGLGLDYIFMAVAPTLRWLFVGRLISGITASNVSTAFAYITDVTPPEGRAKRFGLLGAAFGVGFVVGPAVGGLLGQYNLRAPFWAAAVLSLANFLYGLFVLPESLPKEQRAKSAWHMANPMGSLTLLRSHPELAGLSIVVFLYYLAHQSLQNVWVLYTEYRYGWNTQSVGISLALVGICAVIVSGGLVGPYVKKFGERFSLVSGLFYGFLGFAGFGLAWRGWGALAAIPFIALWGVAGPAMQSLMSQRVDATSQGKLQGAINSLRALTGMAGPLLFTQVFSRVIAEDTNLHLPGAPYFVAGTLLVAAMIVAMVVTRGYAVRGPATTS